MKLNKIMMAAVLVFGAASVAQADQGHGTVTFTGSIIDAPCSIDPTSIDQTVDLGQVSNVALAKGGTSRPENFEIKLVNCSLETVKTVTTTFTGAEGKDGRLGLTGTAKGASIAITDGANNLIELGTATAPQGIQDGNNNLLFSAYLKGDGTAAETASVVVPGEFKSVANFTLAYQ
ncbi:fimbrial protein [Serratia proteamaculans]|jgi:type 1 fimbria pilin|uniref:fimbrial protein n=1 Tax=Serratia proteamaculans TaxID=28151 RepID=UPI00217BA521|nr:fimbrial protein [Serratia proteamaculans]CAI0905519.1 Fimbria A protein precursor [Serratia proteamaculans]CAI0972439.1 Fimbria A protein precursor [Serratia proteamaculans]CAI1057190.1 Fimbria A protein precursor [Serratia proteamaculans]CAI1932581.1 Fimbria A protein precursor [Serratia proteamaculans]CAI2010539.1 Fimbria A protein precursor [Serratia proteamaculans]